MKKFGLVLAILALVLVFGLAFVGCGGDSDYDRTIEELFNRIKSDNKANLRANDSSNQVITWCVDHQAWEPFVSGVGSTHGAAPTFTLAQATTLSGWYYATSDSVYVASIPRMISALNSFYASKYKANTAQYNSTSLADGTKLYGWYSFYLNKDGSGGYGGKAGETESPCMCDRYLF